MNLPLVFELCAALAAGVCGSLLLISWKEVPTAYFRTHCHILLALWVIAALDAARAGGSIAPLQWALAGAILAFLSGFAWGLGLPRLGVPLIAAGLLVGVWVLASPSLLRAGSGFNLWLFAPSSKLASGFLLGSTLSAMLLGHHYLTAPAMSLVPLKRLNLSSAFGLIFRACIAALGLWIWTKSTSIQELLSSGIGVYVLAARWLVGLGCPLIAAFLARRTIQIGATQSATGILYIQMILVLFGEATALTLPRPGGIIL